MLYLLDTDSIIFMIRSLKSKEGSANYRKGQRLVQRIKAVSETGSSVGISASTRAELEYGAARSEDPARERAAVEKILAPFDEFAFDAGMCARCYGTIRAALEQEGKSIGAMDSLIAAQALALNATLVSNNTRHFKRVSGLRIENWTV